MFVTPAEAKASGMMKTMFSSRMIMTRPPAPLVETTQMGERNAAAYAKLREKIDAVWELTRDIQFDIQDMVHHYPSGPFDDFRNHLTVLRSVVGCFSWAHEEVEETQAIRAALREQKDASHG